jgi:hypothetical protein
MTTLSKNHQPEEESNRESQTFERSKQIPEEQTQSDDERQLQQTEPKICDVEITEEVKLPLNNLDINSEQPNENVSDDTNPVVKIPPASPLTMPLSNTEEGDPNTCSSTSAAATLETLLAATSASNPSPNLTIPSSIEKSTTATIDTNEGNHTDASNQSEESKAMNTSLPALPVNQLNLRRYTTGKFSRNNLDDSVSFSSQLHEQEHQQEHHHDNILVDPIRDDGFCGYHCWSYFLCQPTHGALRDRFMNHPLVSKALMDLYQEPGLDSEKDLDMIRNRLKSSEGVLRYPYTPLFRYLDMLQQRINTVEKAQPLPEKVLKKVDEVFHLDFPLENVPALVVFL